VDELKLGISVHLDALTVGIEKQTVFEMKSNRECLVDRERMVTVVHGYSAGEQLIGVAINPQVHQQFRTVVFNSCDLCR
jgi:hypothetical protein